MRQLSLIRHAKSSWKAPDLDDHERPLNKRGERDVVTMARYLQSQSALGDLFDVMYSSTAERALELAQVISDFCGVTLIPDLSFYTFDGDELIEILRHLPDQAQRIAVVGHNPAITNAVNQLCNLQLGNVPTSGVAILDCQIEHWQDIAPGCAELHSLTTPKTLHAV